MKETKFFLVDSALLGLLVPTGISGLLLWLLPRGVGHGLRWFLHDIHQWTGFGLTVLAVYHLFLHWDWFTGTGSKLLSRKGARYLRY